ncbi:MAG: AsmA family protein, partial [Phyllobacteriaceae bacterium]|nr:AsmA family protein [Phyllobacteriaceae bacterium]
MAGVENGRRSAHAWRAGFSATADIAAQRQRFSDVEMQLGAARYTGTIERQMRDGLPPLITARLAGIEADVDMVAALAGLQDARLMANLANVPQLGGSDLDFSLSAAPANGFGLTAASIDTALRVKAGVVDIDRMLITDVAGLTLAATGRLAAGQGADTPDITANISVLADDLAASATVLADRFAVEIAGQPMLAALAERASRITGTFANTSAELTLAPAESGQGHRLLIDGTSAAARFGLDASVLLPQGGAAPAKASFEAQDGEAVLALAGLPVLGLGVLGPMRLEAETADVFAATPDGQVQISSAEGDVMSLGHAAGESAAPFRLQVADIEPYALATGFLLPGGGLGLPVAVEGQWSTDDRGLALSAMSGTLGDTPISGALALSADVRPRLTGSIEVGAFDAALIGDLAFAVDGTDGAAPALPFDIDLAVKATSVANAGVPAMTDAQARLFVDAARLRLADMTARLLGGTLAGQAEIVRDGASSVVTANGVLGGLPAAAISGGALGGEIALRFDVAGTGATPQDVLAALNGSAAVDLINGVVRGIGFERFDAILAASDALEAAPDAAQVSGFIDQFVRGGTLQLPDAAAAFTLNQGVAAAPRTALAMAGGRMDFEPQFNLAERSLLVTGTLVPEPGDEAIAGADPSIALTLAGPWQSPELILQPDGLQAFLGQRTLEREQARVDTLQSALVEKQRLRRENRHFAQLIALRQKAENDRTDALRIEADRRAGERAGVDYNFVSRAEFEAMIARHDFLEWADVFGNLYGTCRSDTEGLLASGPGC